MGKLEEFQSELAVAQGALDRAARIAWEESPTRLTTVRQYEILRVVRRSLAVAMTHITKASERADAVERFGE